MIMKNLNISIPKPCHENWNTMTPEDKGRFCSVCEKTVFDFTNATDKQIIEAYNKNPKLCGKFLISQLNRDLIEPKKRKSFWFASVFLGFLTFSSAKATAQGEPKKVMIEKLPDLKSESIIKGDTIVVKEINGVVSDNNGPIPGVNVILKNQNKQVSTDFNGKYSIKAQEGDVLIFSFLGMNEVHKTVGTSNIINTVLADSNKDLIYQVGGALGRRRTFFGRIFHKIGNWFR